MHERWRILMTYNNHFVFRVGNSFCVWKREFSKVKCRWCCLKCKPRIDRLLQGPPCPKATRQRSDIQPSWELPTFSTMPKLQAPGRLDCCMILVVLCWLCPPWKSPVFLVIYLPRFNDSNYGLGCDFVWGSRRLKCCICNLYYRFVFNLSQTSLFSLIWRLT